jgi:hypothetical protein
VFISGSEKTKPLLIKEIHRKNLIETQQKPLPFVSAFERKKKPTPLLALPLASYPHFFIPLLNLIVSLLYTSSLLFDLFNLSKKPNGEKEEEEERVFFCKKVISHTLF